MSRFVGEALLDAVDDGQLGGALVRLCQQALRLVEQPRVLKGDAEAAGERRQQTNVASLKASVRSRFCSAMRPNALPPVTRGARTIDLGGSPVVGEALARLGHPRFVVIDHIGRGSTMMARALTPSGTSPSIWIRSPRSIA